MTDIASSYPPEIAHHFPLPLDGRILRNGRRIVLLAPFRFVDGKTDITIPSGFDSDWNSVPRGLWNVFPPWEYPEAGVVHDFLYQFNGVTRGEADAIHGRILAVLGCPRLKRWASHAALRSFGWAAWKRYREAEKAE